jgi:hypothetical protein
MQNNKNIYYLATFIFFLASCGLANHHVYKLYSGPERPDLEVATLRFGYGIYDVIIDGMKVNRNDYQVIKLDPGNHVINYGITETVKLKAGHAYSLHKDIKDYTYRWIKDDTTDEDVAGERRP